MKNEKYYTPEIEDFAFGLEYEVKHIVASANKNRDSIKLERGQFIEDFIKPDGTIQYNICWWDKMTLGFDMYFFKTFDPSRYRIKCLDESDAESLGWILDTDTGYHIFGNKRICFDKYCHLEISSLSKTLFFGTVKNKSELKRLMTQLNITM